jgi:hypothetical protein
MPVATPTNPVTVHFAPDNNLEFAKMLFANPGSYILGRRPSNGARCSACGREPPSGELCMFVIDPTTSLTASVGIGRCHFAYLRSSVEVLLRLELAGTHPRKRQRARRLRRLIEDLPRCL